MNENLEISRGYWFSKYRELVQVSGKAERTIETEEHSQQKFWVFLNSIGHFGNELSVERMHIIRYAQSLKNYSNGYQIKLLLNLASFYKQAVRQEWISSNPMSNVDLPRKELNVKEVLTVKEMKLLLSAPDLNMVDELRDRTMMELAYSCGLRCHEVTSLKINQLNEDFTLLRVRGKKGREAILPITRVASHFLTFYVEELLPSLNRRKYDHVFISVSSRRPMQPQQMNIIVQKYSDRVGIEKKVSSHVFRYCVATHLANQGVSVRHIQEILRHESIDTTVKYVKHGFDELRIAHQRSHPRGGCYVKP